MSAKQNAADSAALVSDYASVLSLMRVAISEHCDLTNPRARELYDALEVAWTAAMLLAMEERASARRQTANAA